MLILIDSTYYSDEAEGAKRPRPFFADRQKSRGVHGYPSVHGAFFFNRRSYGPVRCGFKKVGIYGAVRYCDISYGAVRCGFEKLEILRCGFEKLEILRCGSVRFPDIRNPTGRFAAVPR